MSIRRAAVWSLTAQYSTFAIQFAASVIISRFFLLPVDVGMFSIALAASLVVSVFQDMGITRFISGQPQMRMEAVPNYSAFAVAIGWMVAIGLACAAPFVAGFYGEPALAPLLWLIASSYVFSPFSIVPAALLTRDMDFRSLFWVNAGSALCGNLVAIGLAADGFGPAALAWGVLASALVRATIANVMRPVLPRIPRRSGTIRPILTFSSFSFIFSVSNAIGQRSEDLIVGRLLGVLSTGLFSRASGLAMQLSTLVTGAINGVFYPAFAKKRDAGEDLAEPYLHLVACNTALNWAAMFGLSLAAEPIVLLLYGENWAGTAPLLGWMALAEILFVAVPLHIDIPVLLGRIRQLVWINLFDTLSAVTILTIGCLYGLQAAAISRICYSMAWWLIYAPYQCRLLGFRLSALLGVYAKSAICALSAGIPMIVAAQFGWKGANLGFFGLILLSGMGVLAWLATLPLVRHPAWGEVRLATDTYARPLLQRVAG